MVFVEIYYLYYKLIILYVSMHVFIILFEEPVLVASPIEMIKEDDRKKKNQGKLQNWKLQNTYV